MSTDEGRIALVATELKSTVEWLGNQSEKLENRSKKLKAAAKFCFRMQRPLDIFKDVDVPLTYYAAKNNRAFRDHASNTEAFKDQIRKLSQVEAQALSVSSTAPELKKEPLLSDLQLSLLDKFAAPLKFHKHIDALLMTGPISQLYAGLPLHKTQYGLKRTHDDTEDTNSRAIKKHATSLDIDDDLHALSCHLADSGPSDAPCHAGAPSSDFPVNAAVPSPAIYQIAQVASMQKLESIVGTVLYLAVEASNLRKLEDQPLFTYAVRLLIPYYAGDDFTLELTVSSAMKRSIESIRSPQDWEPVLGKDIYDGMVQSNVRKREGLVEHTDAVQVVTSDGGDIKLLVILYQETGLMIGSQLFSI